MLHSLIFLVAMTTYTTRSNLRRQGFISVYDVRVDPMEAGGSRATDMGDSRRLGGWPRALYTVRTQRGAPLLNPSSPLISPKPQLREWCHRPAGRVFLLQSNFAGSPLKDSHIGVFP